MRKGMLKIMANIYDVLKRPIITEKTAKLMQLKKLTFEVERTSTKAHIKQTFYNIFSVNVKNIKTSIIKGKKKRIQRHVGNEKTIKKAIVSFYNLQDIKKITNWGK
jgi:large subunit ribosomal protein L23